MIRVEIHETIDRPIEEVFEQLVDIQRYPEWMSRDGIFITCTKDSDGPVGVGTRYTDRTRLGTLRGDVSAFERPHRVVFHYTSRMLGMLMMQGWPGYTLEREGASRTRVHHVAEGHLYGPLKLLHGVIQRVASRERRVTVDALKRSLESARGSPT